MGLLRTKDEKELESALADLAGVYLFHGIGKIPERTLDSRATAVRELVERVRQARGQEAVDKTRQRAESDYRFQTMRIEQREICNSFESYLTSILQR